MAKRLLYTLCAVTLALASACEKPNDTATTEGEKPSAERTKESKPSAPKEPQEKPDPEPDEALFNVAIGDTLDEIIKKKGEPKKREKTEKGLSLEYEEKLPGWDAKKSVAYRVSNPKEDTGEEAALKTVLIKTSLDDLAKFDALKSTLSSRLGDPKESAMLHRDISFYGQTLAAGYETGHLELQALWHGERSTILMNTKKSELDDEMLILAPSSMFTKLYTESSKEIVATARNTIEQIGRPFRLGKFEYVVRSVTRPSKVGEGYHEKAPSDGARWVVVRYTIENVGNETATALAGDLTLIDTQKRKFQPSSEGNTAVSMSEDIDLALSQLQPGIKKQQVAVFEVPASAASMFDISVPEKGLLGNDKKVMRFMWLNGEELAGALSFKPEVRASRE